VDLSVIIKMHQGVGNAAPLFMIGVGILSLINYIRGRGVDGSIIGAMVVGEIMMLAQVVLGLILLFSGLYPARLIHFLYGTLTILALPALWVYTRGETDRRASLIWALAGLFMMGLALRAIGTAT
jgi:hypothetical protein